MKPEEVTFQLLQEMTDDFSSERKLGEGSFGVVYRGVTHRGEDVAVKMLKPNFDNTGSKQFKNEIYHLGMLRHQNIVEVLGYCYEIEKKPMVFNGKTVLTEESHRAICLEYLHNGSLQDHLSDESIGLDWDTRFKIIKGTCEGLKYFHHDLEEHLYHLDLKPDNILLDKDMAPKVADFGLSMIFGKELKTTTTQYPLGTHGYQPPEYIEKGEVSDKFDIFSLGVVMINIVSGPEGYHKSGHMTLDEFTNQVRKNWRHRLEKTFNGSSLEMYCQQVETCIQTALDCVKNPWQTRPDIVMITESLNKVETDNCTLPWNGFCKEISRTTRHNNMTEMRKEFKDITGRPQNIKLLTSPNCSELEFVDAKNTSSDVVKELIIGREEEKGKIMASLLKVISEKIIILPIHGIGGIGKTTLARLIYNDPEFKHYSHVWVDVSQRFGLNKIRESIVSQLYGEERYDNERQTMQDHLNNLLSQKKLILIVLDDLWEDNQFRLDELKVMLNNKDSKIIVLVTTRSQNVADRICTNHQSHEISHLTNGMCWDIIKHRSGFEARDDKEQLEGIGLEIAQKCSGVALAAQSLGFTLRSMNVNQWMKVKDSDIWNSQDDILASLKLSYSYMDPCLKKCFTYCAIFPKGHKMVKDDLVYQWISLDFIEPTRLLSKMHLCEKHILQLLGLSFFQHYSLSPKTTGAYHKDVTLFEMHDLVHDLAKSVTVYSQKKKSVTVDEILDAKKEGSSGGSSFCYALLTDCSEPLEAWTDSPHKIRAMHFLDCRKIELHTAAISSAESLRVLDLSECCIQELSDSISKLKQLRYLKAPWIKGRKLPNCITKLSKLKYLILHGSSAILELPESIGEMKDLIHLDLSGCSGIDKLPESIGEIENLLHLDLSGCSGIKKLPESSRNLKSLVHLDLSNCSSLLTKGDILGGLTKLQYLSLRGCCRFLGIRSIGNLTELRYLNLSEMLDRYQRILKFVSSLCKLEYLDLSRNDRLEELPECLGSLRKLHKLDLSGCRSLRKVPKSICDIGSLKILIVNDCNGMHSSSDLQFEVHAADGELSSNLILLKEADPTNILKINRLQNVKSTEEVQIIKLKDKRTIVQLRLEWTRGVKRFVEDIEVLEQLVPPMTLNNFDLRGYNSIKFPSWVMHIAVHLPILTKITIFNLPKCNSLPPLGQLPKLRELVIRKMESVTKIDTDFYGGARGFPQLNDFCLIEMEGLEEWITTISDVPDCANTSMFPVLEALTIRDCPKLKLKSCPPRAKYWKIENCDNVISSWEERGQTSASSSVSRTYLRVKYCKVPLNQWRLLHHLPALTRLSMEHCSDLANSAAAIIEELSTLQSLSLQNIDEQELPKWLAELTSLKELDIRYCRAIKSLPDSLQALTKLEELYIYGCPELKRWCELEENKRNLARINISIADKTNKLYRVMSTT